MASRPIDGDAVRRLRAPLLRWYDRAKRDLPWRRTTDPYAIWVSEVMLQQTTVAAVIPYWERFLERFPDAATLAGSREDDVLALWSGLGYYRRAQALRRGAIAVMEHHGGRVPETPDVLLGLPGIGRYTAGAIASVAFGRETPIVDGNVKRVFSRLFAIRQGLKPAAERAHWLIAEALVRGSRPGDLNQAVMELGATVCTPRAPRCDVCPVARWCRARELGQPTAFPARNKSAPVRVVPVAAAWIERGRRILLEQRQPGGPFRGAWDLPSVASAAGETPGRALVRALAKRHRLRLRVGGVLLRAKHSILASRLVIDVVEATPVGAFPRRTALRWVELDKLDGVAISGATKKIARAALAQRRSHDSLASVSSGSRGRAKA
jgi:A/G-specific adenine glycosylase